MTKQVRQAITPTHVLGSTGTDTADDLGYRALADLKSDMGLNLADLAQTWNDSGTTFTGIKLNVTDTASASGSLLMDLQVGGSSKFKVGKNGTIYGPGFSLGTSAGFAKIGSSSGALYAYFGVGNTQLNTQSFFISSLSSAILLQSNNRILVIGSTGNHPVEMRNGVNPQTFNLYNTYTDASNYERGFMKWNSNVLEIGTEAGGTGTARDVVLNGANRVSKISDVSTGTDAAYETAINAIIDALEAHGLAASV